MNDAELVRRMQSGAPPLVLDVRSRGEFAAGHIPGAVHAPLPHLLHVVRTASVDKGALLVLVCEHGPRAQLARVLLKLRGYRRVDLLDGHMSRWRNAGRLLKKGA